MGEHHDNQRHGKLTQQGGLFAKTLPHHSFCSSARVKSHNTDKMPSEAGHRLYVKGRHLSYKRSRHTTKPAISLIQIEGVDNTEAANFYRQAHRLHLQGSQGGPW